MSNEAQINYVDPFLKDKLARCRCGCVPCLCPFLQMVLKNPPPKPSDDPARGEAVD